MTRRLAAILSLTLLALNAQPSGKKNPLEPTALYIVSEFVSDKVIWNQRILDIRADGPDAIVRYIRVTPQVTRCQRAMVQAVETRLKNTSPAALVGSNNPCAVAPKDLDRALRGVRQGGGFQTLWFGIVATCGSEKNVLHLPETGYSKKKVSNKQIEQLWYLAGEIESRVFGAGDFFQGITQERDWELQGTGQALVPEMTSGKYDEGWAEPGYTFRKLLSSYKGPVQQNPPPLVPTLENAESFKFSAFTPPPYPVLALTARVTGKVELELHVDSAMGTVVDVQSKSGNKMLLVPSLFDTIKKWRLVPDPNGPSTMTAVLNYSLTCP